MARTLALVDWTCCAPDLSNCYRDDHSGIKRTEDRSAFGDRRPPPRHAVRIGTLDAEIYRI